MKIFHIDMNSFFASCEQSQNPDLMKKPVIVCGDPEKRAGIVLAASYEAKAFGVKTTMLVHEAEKCCPRAIFVPCNYRLYSDISNRVMNIFDDFTPSKEQASIDEAYLDMTGSENMFGDSISAAKLIQNRIKEELNLGCSIGISSNKFLAKMASDMKKPMGITVLFEEDVPRMLHPLKVKAMYGVGNKTAEKLNSIGIYTVGQLAKTNIEVLKNNFGEKSSLYMINAANGKGSQKIDSQSDRKNHSISNEMTYSKDLINEESILNELLFLCDTVGFRLRKEGRKARCITLKLKYSNFSVLTRSMTCEPPFDSTKAIFSIVSKLFKGNWKGQPIRLMGVGVSGFDNERQMSMFDILPIKEEKADEVMDGLRNKFGYESISRGSLIGRKHKKL